MCGLMHCLEGISGLYFHSPVLAHIQNFSEKNLEYVRKQ